MTQGTLFHPTAGGLWRANDPGENRPGLVAANAPETSRKAARSIAKASGAKRLQILEWIRSCGPRGATCDEVEQALGMSHQTASARIRELATDNHLDTNGERPTRTGRAAAVYIVRGVSQ